jgi:hypothetical protein
MYRESQVMGTQMGGTQESPWVDTQFQLEKARKLFEEALLDTPSASGFARSQSTGQSTTSRLLSAESQLGQSNGFNQDQSSASGNVSATPLKNAQVEYPVPMSTTPTSLQQLGPSQDTWIGTQFQLEREREKFDRDFLLDTPTEADSQHPRFEDAPCVEETPAIVHQKRKKRVPAKQPTMHLETPVVDERDKLGNDMDKFAWIPTDTPTVPKKINGKVKVNPTVPNAPMPKPRRKSSPRRKSNFDDAFATPAPRPRKPIETTFEDAFRTLAPAPRAPKKPTAFRGGVDPDKTLSTPLLPDHFSPFKTFTSPPPDSPTARLGERQNRRQASPVPINLFTQVDEGKTNAGIFDSGYHNFNSLDKWPLSADKENQMATPDRRGGGFGGGTFGGIGADGTMEDDDEDLIRDVTKMLDDDVWDIDKEMERMSSSVAATPVQQVTSKLSRSARLRRSFGAESVKKKRW